MNIRALLLAMLALPIFGRPALGIIVINPSDTAAETAPANGAPWEDVAQLYDQYGARASAVYLGNGYIITANHVDNDMNLVQLDNTDFTLDSSFTPVVINGTDMRIMKLSVDPGLAMMPLINSTESAFNKSATMIGYGLGKGTVVPNQGWNWSVYDSSKIERWATNTTLGSYYNEGDGPLLQTAFNIAGGNQMGQLTLGDSGGGLFIKFGGVWTLAGINEDVTTDGQALYDNNPSLPGNQPDHSYFSSVLQFTSQIDAIIGPAAVGGAVQYWDGAGPAGDGIIQGGSGNWNATATNWTDSLGTISLNWQKGTANFSAPGGGTVTLTSAISAEGLVFGTTGYTIAGTYVLTLTGSAPEIDVTNAGDGATISAHLAGTAGLIVGGAGTLILTNANNSYTGATTINTATLQIGTAAAAGKISASSAVTLEDGGTLSLVKVSGNTFANKVATGTGGGTLSIGSTTTMTLSGALTDDGVNLLAVTQSGTGTTILTNANNSYSGPTTVSGGVLQIGTTSAAGSMGAASAVSVNNGGTLGLINVSGRVLGSVTNGVAGLGTVNINSGNTTTVTGALTDGASGQLALTQNGTGTTILANAGNTYSGATTINKGVIQIGTAASAGSIGASSVVTVANGSSLTFENVNGNSFGSPVTDNAHVVANAGASSDNYTIASTISGTGDFKKLGTNTVTLTGANTYRGVTSINAGTLLVNNTAGSGTGSGAVSVNAKANLGGSGTISGPVTLNSGGTIAPGAGSPGVAGTTLSGTSLKWNGGGALSLQIASTSTADELVLSGALTEGSAGTYDVKITGTGAAGGTYTLATFASTTFAQTDFTLQLPSGDVGSLVETSTSLTLDLTTAAPAAIEENAEALADTTNTVSEDSTSFGATISPTPEPTSAALLALGGGALLGWRRRRKA